MNRAEKITQMLEATKDVKKGGVRLHLVKTVDDEYIVQWIEKGKVNDDKSYYTDDKKDAIGTMQAMAKEIKEQLIAEAGNVDMKRAKDSGAIQVPEREAKRLMKLGVKIPKIKESGPIVFKGKEVGFANDWNGVTFTDMKFIEEYVEEMTWYVSLVKVR